MDHGETSDLERVQDLAIELFDLGFNCAEAALVALGCAPGWSLPEGADPALGFGAGLARWGFTCGCLTGSAMALGTAAGRREPEDAVLKEAVYSAVDEVVGQFQERFGSTQCRSLVGIDFKDPEDRKRYGGDAKARCRDFLAGAVGLALEQHGRVASAKTDAQPEPPRLRLVQDSLDDAIARFMLKEYAASLHFSLCFQDFNRELDDLATLYHHPSGSLLLAWVGDGLAGCVALRTLAPGLGEMKRLYVRPQHRGTGLGRLLTQGVLQQAAALGFQAVRLDTVPSMTTAIALYRKLGFQEIPPYRRNPVPGALYFEKRI